jgi:diguanylate cyclase (GGDEF)-like protein
LRRKLLVPVLVVLLGVTAIAAITVLQDRERRSQSAELKLARLQLALAKLQDAPYKANAATGGSAALAAGLMQSGESEIATTLAELQQSDPPPALAKVQAPLIEFYAVLDRVYAIGVSPGGYNAEAGRLVAVAGLAQAEAVAQLDAAGAEYAQRVHDVDNEAIFGAAAAILLLVGAFAFLYIQNQRLLAASRREALSDPLTGLANRRAFQNDLGARLPRATVERPLLLGLFDLDGFKQYNDTFGHPAGDALLVRLGERLRLEFDGRATAYRMGGDEFCLLASVAANASDELVQRAAAVLSESSDAFTITCSYGSALLPTDATAADDGLRLADHRMYAQKSATASAGRQSSDVLLKVLSERSRSLESHVSSVGRFARLVAERLQLSTPEQERIQLAAELHDIGKTAIPDSLLNKPGKLSAEEWEYMRRHTLIGERIILAAPALADTAALVRSSHERIDGTGYPDGLAAGEIPLGSRIIAVCDAFDAMISDRTYRTAMPVAEALEELSLHAGTQFDPMIVEAFQTLIGELKRGELGLAA